MAVVRDQYAVQDPLLSTETKNFLEGFKFGRWALRVGRNIIRFLRKSRDPLQHKLWMSHFGLPLRTAMLLNRPLTVSIEGISVQLVPRGQMAGEIWAGVRCESREIAFLLRILQPGMIFFDVGANAGLFAISAAKKIGGKGVFAFEPCSATYELLKQNLLLNGLADVIAAQIALAESVGQGELQINARGKDGLNTLGKPIHPDSRVVDHEKVRMTTLDAFMQEHNVARVDVMKVDIEGAELLMFRGARNLLQRPDAPLILYEGFGFLSRGFGYHPVEILWFLESCGYTLLLLNSDSGEISELKPDYRYDSMVIAVKPGNAAFEYLRARLK